MNVPEVPLSGVLRNPTERGAVTTHSDPTARPDDHGRRYPPITITVASTRAEREGAFRLVYQR